jgi:hypothetical protein
LTAPHAPLVDSALTSLITRWPPTYAEDEVQFGAQLYGDSFAHVLLKYDSENERDDCGIRPCNLVNNLT